MPLKNATSVMGTEALSSWDDVLSRVEGGSTDDGWRLTSHALQELSRLGIPADAGIEDRAVVALKSLSRHPRWQIRQAVVETLPNFQFSKVKEILEEMRLDPTRWVKESAEVARKKLRVSTTIDKRDRNYDYAVGLVRHLKRKYPEMTSEMMDDILKLSFKTGERYFEEVASQALHQVKTLIFSLADAVKDLEGNLKKVKRLPAGTLTSVRKIRSEKQNLKSLFDSLMNYARPWEGKFAMEDSARLMADAAERAKKLANDAHRKAIRWDVSYAQALRLVCDRERLVEALANLITNAMESMPHGGTVGLRIQPGSVGKVHFVVSDNGPGMSSEDLEMNKRPGATGKHTKGQKHWHSGLGLTYAVKVVELGHGGQIRLDKTTTAGTTLIVELPILRDDDGF